MDKQEAAELNANNARAPPGFAGYQANTARLIPLVALALHQKP